MVLYSHKPPALGVRSYSGLGMSSLALGFFGLVFFWLVPFGISLSLAGLIVGLIGWGLANGRNPALNLAIGGTLLSAAALAINLVIATGGWTT